MITQNIGLHFQYSVYHIKTVLKYKSTFTLILYLLMFLSSEQSYAQETKNAFDLWLESYNQGISFYNTENYSDAIPHLQEALKYIDNIDFNTSNETKYYPIDNENYLGICYYRLNQFKDAEIHFKNALEQLKMFNNPNQELYKQIEENLLNTKNNINSQKTLEERIIDIKNLEGTDGKNNLNYAQQLFALAFHYKNTDNENKFYEKLIEVELILSSLGKTNGDYYGITAFYLAGYYAQINQIDIAFRLFKKAESLSAYTDELDQLDKIRHETSYSLVLIKLKNYSKASDKLNTILSELRKNYPNDLESYIFTLDHISYINKLQQKTTQNISLYKNAIQYANAISGELNENYGLLNIRLAERYMEIDNYNDAKPYLDEGLRILKELNLENSYNFAMLMSDYGLYNFNKGNYKSAENQYIKSLELQKKFKKNFNKNELNLVSTEGNLATLYSIIGEYGKAEKLHVQSLEKKVKYPLVYAQGLMSYGNLLIESSQYSKAKQIYNKCEAVIIQNLGTEHELYAKYLLNIGQLYHATRELKQGLLSYYKAEDVFNEINKNMLSYGLAIAKSGQGLILDELGDLDAAIAIQIEALKILEETTGKNQIDYGKVAQNIAQSYQAKGDLENVTKYYELSLKNYEASIGKNHYLYAILLTNMSQVLIDKNEMIEADKLIKSALEIIEKSLSTESLYYTTALKLLALSKLKQKDFEGSRDLMEDLKPRLKNIAGAQSDVYIDLLVLMGINYDLLKEYKLAQVYYEEYNNGILNLLSEVFTYRSEEDKKKYLLKLKDWLAWYGSLILQKNHNSPKLIESNLNNQLVLKGLLLNSTRNMFQQLESLNNELISSKINSFRELKSQLSSELKKVNGNSKKDIEVLKKNVNIIETELVEFYNSRFNSYNSFRKNWKNVQAQLKTDEIVLEFSFFNKRSISGQTDDVIYTTYLIHKDWEQPKVVELFKEADLKAILKNQNPNTLYQTRGSKAKSATNTKGLYELIWLPIEQHLEGIETIYFSPSGLLNQIPFAALDTEDKPILASQYNLVQLSSTYALTEERAELKANNTLFIGGINYEYTPSESKTESKDAISQLSALKSVSGTRSFDSKWNYLPGTLKEVNTIASLFSKQNKTYSSLAANNATETSFKNLSGDSPNVIHIATHGFFFENPKNTSQDALNVTQQNIYTVAEDPLLRSGLLFSGANYAWQNGNNPYAEDDGILTALEISNLDLSNTDLVVLSACETGLGDIDGSEGVYGLQRAFKMAGVDLIMMSLWEVPDTETSEFMTIFYTNWLNGQKVRTAFRNTQLTMAETYKDNPEKWAAFVLFE